MMKYFEPYKPLLIFRDVFMPTMHKFHLIGFKIAVTWIYCFIKILEKKFVLGIEQEIVDKNSFTQIEKNISEIEKNSHLGIF